MAPNSNEPPTTVLILGPGPINLIFVNQIKRAPNNNINPGGPGPLNLIFANWFKNAPTIVFKWLPILMGPQQ